MLTCDITHVAVEEIEPGMHLVLDGRMVRVVQVDASPSGADLEAIDDRGGTVFIGLNPHRDGYPVLGG